MTKRSRMPSTARAGLATLRSSAIPGLSVVTIASRTASMCTLHGRKSGAPSASWAVVYRPASERRKSVSPLVSSTMDLLKLAVPTKVDPYRAARHGGLDHQAAAAGGTRRRPRRGGLRRGSPATQFLPDIQKLASFNIFWPTCRRRLAPRCRCAAPVSSMSLLSASIAICDSGAGYQRHWQGGGRGPQRHAHLIARHCGGESRSGVAVRRLACIMGEPGVMFA